MHLVMVSEEEQVVVAVHVMRIQENRTMVLAQIVALEVVMCHLIMAVVETGVTTRVEQLAAAAQAMQQLEGVLFKADPLKV